MKTISMFLLFMLLLVASAGATDTHYRIGEGDTLRITVYDNPDLTTQTRVSSNGTIDFPLIGTVQISGQTVAEVTEAIRTGLADGYLVDPQVAIFVEEFRSQKVVIMGQVKNPGLYELSGPTTVLQLISKAGGLTPDADETISIRRSRNASGGEQVITVDLQETVGQGDSNSAVPVIDGDTVVVNQAGVFFVTGEVKRPDSYKLQKGTSVITAITKAGGFTELAAKGKVRIIRKNQGTEEVLKNVPMHEPVKANDVILVPESFF